MSSSQCKFSVGRGATRSILALASLMAVLRWAPAFAAAGGAPYPVMAAVSQYMMSSRAAELALAKSAAPASISDRAEVLVLGKRGYKPAVKGSNGFVCFVGRSWDLNFTDPEFWNPRIRAPQCDNAAAARSVLPRYLRRTDWVLARVTKAEMQRREAAEWVSGKLKEPEPGAVSYMMSKGGYINNSVGHWYPHVMFFTPRMNPARWGANLPGSPVMADDHSYAHTNIFLVVVPNWSDGTPGPSRK